MFCLVESVAETDKEQDHCAKEAIWNRGHNGQPTRDTHNLLSSVFAKPNRHPFVGKYIHFDCIA